MSIGHQRLYGRFFHEAVQVLILDVWIPGAVIPAPTPHHVKQREKNCRESIN